MGTEVLTSHDCLRGRFPLETFASPSPKHGRNPNRTRSGRRKRSPSDSESDRLVVKSPAKNLVMGQVRILKRGEEIGKTIKVRRSEKAKVQTEEKSKSKVKIENSESEVFSKVRLGPEPEMIPKQIRLANSKVAEVFAGSALVASPSPSSLPFPVFFTKKVALDSPINDTATKNLQRLLRLDLMG